MTARTRSKRSPASAHHVGAILEEVRTQQAAMLEEKAQIAALEVRVTRLEERMKIG